MKVGLPQRKTDRRYTYADYKTWPDDERWELIDGVAWNMTPTPSRDHQLVGVRLTVILGQFFDTVPCRVFVAPYDVFFPDQPNTPIDEVVNVVQPDLAVLCGEAKDQTKGCWGAPDLAVEILSPSTTPKDLREKFDLYERSGVREYWIVDPRVRYIRVLTLGQDGSYGDGILWDREGVAASRVFDGLTVDLAELFSDLLES